MLLPLMQVGVKKKTKDIKEGECTLLGSCPGAIQHPLSTGTEENGHIRVTEEDENTINTQLRPKHLNLHIR